MFPSVKHKLNCVYLSNRAKMDSCFVPFERLPGYPFLNFFQTAFECRIRRGRWLQCHATGSDAVFSFDSDSSCWVCGLSVLRKSTLLLRWDGLRFFLWSRIVQSTRLNIYLCSFNDKILPYLYQVYAVFLILFTSTDIDFFRSFPVNLLLIHLFIFWAY